MTLVPLASGAFLILLVRTDFARSPIILLLCAIPALIFMAPSPVALALTMACEAPIVLALAGPQRRDGRAVLLSLPVNGMTQPLLYSGLTHFASGRACDWWVFLALAELAVAVVEAFLYFMCLAVGKSRISAARSLAMSLAANAFSAAVGLLLPV